MTAIAVTLCLAIVYLVAMVRSCDVFAYVPGYDRCQIPSAEDALPYLMIAVLPAFLLPVRPTAGTGIIWIVYFMHVFGAVMAAPFVSNTTQGATFFSLFVSLSFILVSWLSKLIRIPFVRVGISFNIFNVCLFAALAGALTYLLVTFPINFKLPSIYDVYDVRAEFIETMEDNAGGIGGYVMLISAYSLVPIGIISSFSLYRNNKFLQILFLLTSFFMMISVYSAAAFKSSVFVFALVIAVYLFIGDKYPFRRMLLMFSVISISALLLDISNIHHDSLIHWFRRVFIVPGLNVQFYLSEFGFFNNTPVPDAPLLISQTYFGTDGSANAGLYGNGLARGGWQGIGLVLFIFCLILVVADTVGGRIPLRISISLLFPSAYALANSSITTVLLSYGLMVNFIFLYGLANLHPAKMRDR